MQDEFDCGPGSFITLDLPPHWRSAYWAYAIWSVGATTALPSPSQTPPGQSDLLITSNPEAAEAATSPVVLVTLAALARSAVAAIPAAMDEARELATFADRFQPWQVPSSTEIALVTADGGETAYGDLILPESRPGLRKHLSTTDLDQFLRETLSVWAADGSVVLSRGSTDPHILAQRLAAEGATAV